MDKKIAWPVPGLDLSQEYGLKEPVLVSRGNQVLRLSQDGKDYALTLLDLPWEKLPSFQLAMELLMQSSFTSYAKVIRAKSGQFFTSVNKEHYSLSTWQIGRLPSFRDYDDLIRCAKTLGQLHNRTKGYLSEADNLKLTCQMKLNKFKKLSIHTCPAPLQPLHPLIIEAAEKASFLLPIAKDSFRFGQPTALCHNNLSRNAFRIESDGACSLLNFTHCQEDFPQTDLAQLLTQVLYHKQSDKNLALKVIAAYCHDNPLTQEGLGMLVAFLYFPRSFWSLIEQIYKSNPMEQQKAIKILEQGLAIHENVDSLAKDLAVK